MRRWLPLLSLTLALAARAQELSEIAAAEREERLALERVEAAHGNKPPQELSAEERAQIIREQQAASREVYERRALDPKSFAGRVMRLTPAERAAVDAEKKRLDGEAKARAAAEPEEIEITHGIDEKHPVDLYREPGAVEVENLQDEGAAPEPPPPAKPSKAVKQKPSKAHKTRRK